MAKIWTNNECDICANYILENTANLQISFKLTSKHIGRSFISIYRSFYKRDSTLGKYLLENNIYESIRIERQYGHKYGNKNIYLEK